MKQRDFSYHRASQRELEWIWDKDIAKYAGDSRWPQWKVQYLEDNRLGNCQTFVVCCQGEPVGQGTLIFSPFHGTVNGRLDLADGCRTVNLNALRIEELYEGQGHISRLVRLMEQSAAQMGYREITIGVEARETRNLAIYLHWGYDRFVRAETEEGELVLYYAKSLADGAAHKA